MPDRAPPPTIASLRAQGLRAVLVRCLGPDCHRPAVRIGFDVIGLPDATPFPEIVKRRRFRCQACGSDRVEVSPDWRDHNAQGAGKQRP